MAQFSEGDLVVLKSGSMRMIVESIEGEKVHCLWCNEGQIGRDTFPAFALNRWEVREDGDRPARPPRPRPDGDAPRPYKPRARSDEEGAPRPYKPRARTDDEGAPRPYKPRAPKADGDGPAKPYKPRARKDADAPDRNTGWDGKPREKKFYRKDD